MGEAILPILATLFIIVLIVAFVRAILKLIQRGRLAAQHQKRFIAFLERIGFREEDSKFLKQQHKDAWTKLRVLRQGRRSRPVGLWTGTVEGWEVVVCLITFTTGLKEHTEFHRRTIFLFCDHRILLPYFMLTSEGAEVYVRELNFLVARHPLGMVDLFENMPEFQGYRIQSDTEDKNLSREMFVRKAPKLKDLLDRHLCAEGSGHYLAIWHDTREPDESSPPDQENVLHSAVRLANAFRS